MRRLCTAVLALVFFPMLIAGPGCKPKATMPSPIPVDQLPTLLEKAFASAATEAKDLAGQVATSVKAQDYTKAHPQLQTLAAMPNLNKDQLDVTARGLLTLNQLLQNAQTQGDQKAAQTLQNYRANK